MPVFHYAPCGFLAASPINSAPHLIAQVQKSAQHYTDAARDEIKLLSIIRQGDESDAFNCVRLLDCFDHIGPHGRHVCLVFEVLGDNLLALIKHYDYRGIPTGMLRRMSRQVC